VAALAEVNGSSETLQDCVWAEAPANDSLQPAPTSVSEVCIGSQLLAADDDDDEDDEELHGEAALVTSSAPLGVLRQRVEHGVVEQLVDPTSNFGVSQKHEDVHSGVPYVEHATNSRCNATPPDRTLTKDCDVLIGNTASRNSFLNTYSGCFRPTSMSQPNSNSEFICIKQESQRNPQQNIT